MSKEMQMINKLISAEEIRNMIARYGIGADQKNSPRILKPLFAEDAVWSCEGFGEFTGNDTIASALSKIAKEKIIWSFHAMANPWIKVAADNKRAKAEWALWELSTVRSDGRAIDTIMAGFYEASLIHNNGTWLFHRLKLDLKVQSDYSRGFN